MKKVFLLGAMVCALGMMTACKSGTTNDNNSGWVDLGLPSGLLWATCNVLEISDSLWIRFPEELEIHYPADQYY